MACHVLFVRGGSMRRIGHTRLHRLTVVVAGSAMMAATLVACSSEDEPKPTLNAFLAGWHTRQWDKMGFVAENGQAIPASQVATELRSLSGELADRPIKLTAGDPKVTKDDATAPVTVDWTIA